MSEFTFLYRGRDTSASPEQMQKTMEKWVAWFKQLESAGALKYPGQPLEHTGKVVKGKQKTVTDGPYAEAKDVIGGYAIIEAKDLDAAVRARQGLPDSRGWRFRRGAPHPEDVDGEHRAPLPARGGADGLCPHADLRNPQPRAGGRRRAGRVLPRAGGVEIPGRAGESFRVAHGHREESRARRAAARAHRAYLRARAGEAARERMDACADNRGTLRPKAIQDDQLRMMFSCCHAQLREEAQVALILHILCGFSVDEIAEAFVSPHSTIEKRITRSKKVLATSKKLFDVTSARETSRRLPAVQRALYLLFNEGYHGASAKTAVRVELCHEAMRLTSMLLPASAWGQTRDLCTGCSHEP